MKKGVKILAIIPLILLITAPGFARDEKVKIGYVDLYRVFSEYKETRKSEKTLEKKAQDKNKERDNLMEEIKKLQEEAELLSQKEKKKKEAAIEDKLRELQDFDRAVRDELTRKRDNMGRDVLLEIGKGIKDYGKKQKFDVILDSRTLFYANEAIDVTDEIIKDMNKEK